MSESFDMDIFLSGMLTGSYAPASAIFIRQRSSKPQYLGAESYITLGLGKGSILVGS